ncbi:MAG: tagaturonate reductase [Bacteroidetes bacterium]|nr:tagaturonate reductase [Bacteroidota bacterium]MDA1119778.1 tagaturonate reductase [Bacteroidota bacterium]
MSFQSLNRNTQIAKKYPIKILQFGTGNFLRAFVDWMIHEMNDKGSFNAGVVVVPAKEQGLVALLNEQQGLYTLYLNGIKNGKAISEHQLIDCIQHAVNPYENYQEYLQIADNPHLRFVVSNTTEAGITYNEEDTLSDKPSKTFPAKLTALLYRRFKTFSGDPDKGWIILPSELIDGNGDKLKTYVLQYATDWSLGNEFIDWVENANTFCNTLVDRIVPGYPKEKIDEINLELGYDDKLVVEGEQFHLWVIEGPDWIKEELPTESAGLNVVFTNNMEPYRTSKVRILNGAHTAMVPVAYLYGIETVREAVENDLTGNFIKETIFNEICPTLDLPLEELEQFANDVLDRFRNPYLKHELISISLNSISKFKTRVLPSIMEYHERKNAFPERLLFSFASLFTFYRGEYHGKIIQLNDDPENITFFSEQWNNVGKSEISLENLVFNILSKSDFWGRDLSEIRGITEAITAKLHQIQDLGMFDALKTLNNKVQI